MFLTRENLKLRIKKRLSQNNDLNIESPPGQSEKDTVDSPSWFSACFDF